MIKRNLFYILFSCGTTAFVGAEAPGEKIYQQGFLSKEESLKSIELPEGYSLELILSEPEVEEPVMCAWDANGAMYVVEMRSYMQDADATGEQKPISRITKNEDTNGDGIYDKQSVFADELLLPRFVLPLDDRVIVGLTNTLDLWTYRDTTGDGVADEKIKIYEGGKRGGNMEHQPSGLTWGLDNWLYLTYEATRYRFTDGKFEVENLPRGNGQWGLTQDNWGRLYFSRAGGEIPAEGFQQPPGYQPINLRGEEKNFRKVYPIAEVPDVQGGRGRVGPNGGLDVFSGCAGQSIFRGDRLPKEMEGSLIIPEPVGRLIRRANVDRKDARTTLSNAYPESEFIRTRDVNFRPVWSATTPGGQVAIVDMHRGIIQQGNWTRPKSYLRGIIDKWGLDKNIGKGRIYRLVHKDFKAGPQPKMLDESTTALVAHLSHPNGWWRDTAQKLIILRSDRETAVPQLEELVLEGDSELGRMHALWTLEGMKKLKPELVASAIKDKASIVRASALRVAEPFMAAEDQTVLAALQQPFPDDIEMSVQYLNSLYESGTQNATLIELGKNIITAHADLDVIVAMKNARSAAAGDALLAASQQMQGKDFAQSMQRGKVIYEQLCFACHGADGQGAPMVGKPGEKLAPSFVRSPRVVGTGESAVRVMLNGLTGDIEGRQYEGLMVSMGTNDDQWIADAVTYIRNSFGNKSSAISPKFVGALRKQHSLRSEPWTIEELEKLEAPILPYEPSWKLSASHMSKDMQLAFDGDAKTGYSTGESMAPDMWVQVEFPNKTKINGIVLESRGSRRSSSSPRGYAVQASDDGKSWGKPLATGQGKGAKINITFPPTEAKFIRITQTGKDKVAWEINEMMVMGKKAE